MKRNIINSFFAILSLALAVSCADDIFDISEANGSLNCIEVGYSVDNELEETRGIPANARECRFEEVYALFFEKEPESRLVATKKFTVRESQKKLSFEPPKELSPDTEYDILLVANAKYYLPDGMTDTESLCGKYLNASRAKVESEFSLACSSAITYRYPELLPMWGKYVANADSEEEIPFSYKMTEENGVKTYYTVGEFRFSRIVERVDLLNLVPETLDVRWAKVCNYRDKGLAYIDGFVPGDSGVIPLENENPDPTPSSPGDYAPAEDVEGGGQEIKEALYAFPNIVQTAVQNDKSTTCLIIAGYYIDPNTKVKDSNLTYYRFNLANVGEAQLLKRNFVYTAVIKGIKRRGKPTDLEAYNDNIPIFDYNVDDEWQITDENYKTDGKGNFIILSKTHITFTGEQSSADKIELKVSTNPELTWTIEPVTQAGGSNDKFTCQKFTEKSIKAGPISTNDTPYVRFGYYKVVAKNKNPNSTPVNMELKIYLQQLTLDPNFKCLTVNGSPGPTIDVSLPGSGGSVILPVVTGSSINNWVATSSDFTTARFGKTASFTSSGGNNTDLIIKVEPNTTSGPLTTNIVVRLDPNDPIVGTITLRCTQPRTPNIMALSPMITNNKITINAFSTAVGNINGVVNPYQLYVKILDPSQYYYKVESGFDKYRDVILSTGSPATSAASHPDDGTVVNNDAIYDMTSGSFFYINPYRTGPGDKDITSTIKISAYKIGDTSRKAVETITLNVTITTTPVRIDDVVINVSGTYYLFPDRSLGMQKRTAGSTRNIAKMYGKWTNIWINSDQGREYICNNSEFNDLPGATGTQYGWFNNTNANTYVQQFGMWPSTKAPEVRFLELQEDAANLYSPFYHTGDTKWIMPPTAFFNHIIANKIIWSKTRPFLVSDVQYDRPVCCWIQYPDKTVTSLQANSSYGNNEIRNAGALYMGAYTQVSGSYVNAGNTFCISGTKAYMSTKVYSNNKPSWFTPVRPVRTMTTAEINTWKTYLTKGPHF